MKLESGKAKILMVEPFLTVGGEERIVLNLLKHLSGDSYDIELVCSPGGPLLPQLRKLNMPLHFIDMQSKWDWHSIGKLITVLHNGHFDLVHGHSSFAGLFVRIANLLSRRIPIVWTDHLLPFQHHPWTLSNKVLGRLYTLPFYLLESISDRIVYVSETAMSERMKYKPFIESKMTLIRNGIDIHFDHPAENRTAFKSRFNIPQKNFTIGLVTVLKWQKGVDIFLYAMHRLIIKYRNITGVIVGSGPDEKDFKQLSDHLGLQDHIVFTGLQNDITKVLPAFDAVVLASRFEGLSITLLEYLAAGLPIIASDISNNREVLGDHECGLLFKSEDHLNLAEKIIDYIENMELRDNLCAKAKQRYEMSYTVDKMTASYEQLYQEVLHRKNTTSA